MEMKSDKRGRVNSYSHGSRDRPLIDKTIGRLFNETCTLYPERIALIAVHQGVRLHYRELGAMVQRVAAQLLALGLERGDRVGIWSPNRYEWVVTQLATAQVGLILVTINPAYRVTELEYALNKAECKALVLADAFKSSDYLEMIRSLAPELAADASGGLHAERLPHLRLVIQLGRTRQPGMLAFSELLEDPTAAAVKQVQVSGARLQAQDPINIQFTSGTTGFPKGATLSHCNILNNGYFVTETLRFTCEDRLCIPVPLYHCFGMVMGVLGCITHGAAMVFPAASFDPESVLKTVAEEQCTALYGVPTMFIAELEHPNFEQYKLTSLRTGIMAGSPCPVDVMKRVIADMHINDITIAYGMTETSPVSFQSAIDDPLGKKVGTVGRVHPHVEVKIIDEKGDVVAVGEPGELCIRGYSVMQRYWEDPEKTTDAIDGEGWMHSGDLAVMDAQGYCNIVGRLKDMIIRGGENIYPREIEEFLFGHEKIRNVAVFGVPDRKYGEQVAAWIQLRDGVQADANEIRAFCRDRIAHFKIPHYIKFVDEFPMTVTGKIQKFVMRQAALKEYGLGEQQTA
jgi:fatty-acyl-CoA synthase